MLISSTNNNYVKKICRLHHKKYRDETSTYLVCGYHLIEEAQKQDLIEEIILLEGETYETTKKNTSVTPPVMKKLSQLDSIPPIIAVAKKRSTEPITGNTIILENLQDPGNLGTIIRSAKAFNFETIIINKGCVDVYNDKVLRATQGMIFHTNIIIKEDLEQTIKDLKNIGYEVLGTSVRNGENIKNITTNKEYAIIIGNEGQGMSSSLEQLCDKNIYINMNKDCESLNASVAASIIMYEVSNK